MKNEKMVEFSYRCKCGKMVQGWSAKKLTDIEMASLKEREDCETLKLASRHKISKTKKRNAGRAFKLKRRNIMENLLSVVSKGNRLARVRTNGTAGYMIELTELKKNNGGEVSKRQYTRLYKMLSTSIREAESWVDLATE